MATGGASKGLLLATMEPPAHIEEEFQDWYDSEHFPERRDCAGFETASRFVCVDGWPRFIALYDLTDVEVLRGPAYAAIAVAATPRGHTASCRRSGVSTAPRACRSIPDPHCLDKTGRARGSHFGAFDAWLTLSSVRWSTA